MQLTRSRSAGAGDRRRSGRRRESRCDGSGRRARANAKRRCCCCWRGGSRPSSTRSRDCASRSPICCRRCPLLLELRRRHLVRVGWRPPTFDAAWVGRREERNRPNDDQPHTRPDQRQRKTEAPGGSMRRPSATVRTQVCPPHAADRNSKGLELTGRRLSSAERASNRVGTNGRHIIACVYLLGNLSSC